MVISILGCGWLGTPLASYFIEKGHILKGSTTTSEKISHLKALGIDAFLLDMHQIETQKPSNALFQCDWLILNIPPKRNQSALLHRYAAGIENLLNLARRVGDARVIFVSSTGVYGEAAVGDAVNESVAPAPDTASGLAMLAAEERVRQSAFSRKNIVRLAGLVGAGRHPGRFLAGKTGLAQANAPVNLVNGQDAVRAIGVIVEKGICNEVFNVCANEHPTRAQFYTTAALAIGETPPIFLTDTNKSAIYKKIDSTKMKEVLELEFKIRY